MLGFYLTWMSSRQSELVYLYYQYSVDWPKTSVYLLSLYEWISAIGSSSSESSPVWGFEVVEITVTVSCRPSFRNLFALDGPWTARCFTLVCNTLFYRCTF
jgi:hypothetical protein